MAGWRTCTVCSRRINGYTAMSRHLRTEHPKEAREQEKTEREKDLTRSQAFLDNYDAYQEALASSQMNLATLALLHKTLGDWPYSEGRERLVFWRDRARSALDELLAEGETP